MMCDFCLGIILHSPETPNLQTTRCTFCLKIQRKTVQPALFHPSNRHDAPPGLSQRTLAKSKATANSSHNTKPDSTLFLQSAISSSSVEKFNSRFNLAHQHHVPASGLESRKLENRWLTPPAEILPGSALKMTAKPGVNAHRPRMARYSRPAGRTCKAQRTRTHCSAVETCKARRAKQPLPVA